MSNLKSNVYISKNRIGLCRRVVSFVLALSVLTCSGIFSAPVGAETVKELICGREEHIHSQECYELICAVEDAEHVHSDECFSLESVCGIDEHVHTEDCYTEIEEPEDETSEDEKPDEDIPGDDIPDDGNTFEDGSTSDNDSLPEEDDNILENGDTSSGDGLTVSLPDFLTGDLRTDIFAVAQLQLGFAAGDDGYTPYGVWFGEPLGELYADDWNLAFACFCLYYGGYENAFMSRYIPDEFLTWLKESELFMSIDESEPVRGDLVFINNGRVGIAADMLFLEDGMVLYAVIEGDVDGKVEECFYTAEQIDGFASFGEVNGQGDDMETLAAPSVSFVGECKAIAIKLSYTVKVGSTVKVHLAGRVNNGKTNLRFYFSGDAAWNQDLSSSQYFTVNSDGSFDIILDVQLSNPNNRPIDTATQIYIRGDGWEFDSASELVITEFYATAFELNRIYYRANGESEFTLNSGSTIEVYAGDTIEVLGEVEGPTLTNSGAPPSNSNLPLFDPNVQFGEAANGGTGFYIGWGQPLTRISYEFILLDAITNRWQIKATVRADGSSNDTLAIRLIKNGQLDYGDSNSFLLVKVNDRSETLFVNTEYGFVDKSVATGMYTAAYQRHGDNVTFSQNSDSNRYIMYVGDTLEVKAQDGSAGIGFEIRNNNDNLNPSTGSGQIAKFIGRTPGTCEVVLLDAGGNVLSTLYVEVRYGIYADSSLGRKHKDKIGEYVDAALWHLGESDLIVDPEGVKVYVKNISSYRYILFPNETVTLSAYVKDGDNTTFTLDQTECFTATGPYVVYDDPNVPHGFKKVELKLTAISNIPENGIDQQVNFGNEIFYINIKHHDNSHHFDIEIADGGTYTVIKTTTKRDGSIETTRTVYAASVSGVNGCDVYRADGYLLRHLNWWEYWEHGEEGGSQYELTSAYETNSKGELIYRKRDSNGNIIYGELQPGEEGKLGIPAYDGLYPEDATAGDVKYRSVAQTDIEKVVFDVEIFLKPLTQTITTEDPEGKITETIVDPDKIETPDKISSVIFEMGRQEIIDAYNKCPGHLGLDFTIKAVLFAGAVQPEALKVLKGEELTDDLFTFELYDKNPAENPSAEPIETTTNKGTHHDRVRFKTMYFTTAVMTNGNGELIKNQTYKYYIKEHVPDNTKYIYDTGIIEVIVKVEQDIDENSPTYGEIKASIEYRRLPDGELSSDLPQFINNVPRKLPVTGGGGIRQYIYFGGAITLIGFILLQKRKRREGNI